MFEASFLPAICAKLLGLFGMPIGMAEPAGDWPWITEPEWSIEGDALMCGLWLELLLAGKPPFPKFAVRGPIEDCWFCDFELFIGSKIN